ncbi:hypothetical protein GCM10022234_11440 [Aeromicrobium panaciterrae]|uniref:hypothetical protein n=1 Tax=Aeromicrobium panaciterrae TaxID=363861 RepID=UPI0031DF10F4
MKQQVAAGILAVSMIGGVGTGVVAHQLRPDDDNAKPNATASTTATTPAPDKVSESPATQTVAPPAAPVLQPASSLRILPGQVGPVKVGMTKAEAYATGYFDKDVQSKNCDAVERLQWKPAYQGTFDIFTLDDGEVSAMGIFKAGPRTRSGLQIGSTYKAVKDVLGEESQPMEAGYSQTGLFVNEGDSWIGFLFDGDPDTISDNAKVVFIEVTRGRLPDLMRDGC